MKDLANPIAMILSAAMMLRIGLSEFEAANDLEGAVDRVLLKGFRTADLMNKNCIQLGCKETGEVLLKELNAEN